MISSRSLPISSEQSQKPQIIRLVIVFLLITPISSYFLFQMELVRYTFPTWVVPLSNVIFILLLLLIINKVFNYLCRIIDLPISNFLQTEELLLLYVMLSLATSLAGCDVLQAVLSLLGHGNWFATDENEWAELFGHHLPTWLTVSNRTVLKGYYMGESSLYISLHLQTWLPVVLNWILLFFLLSLVFLCLNAILYRQWSNLERLTFPIIQLPLAMAKTEDSIFTNKKLWLGICIASAIGLLNGISTLVPSLPEIPITRRSYHFVEAPLNFYGSVTIALYPFAIGIMFLMPLDVLFSTLVFYFLYRNQTAAARAFGIPGNFPYLNEQTLGAFFGLCVFFIWIGRAHFRKVLDVAFNRVTEKKEDKNEFLSYRLAVWGILVTAFAFSLALFRAGMSIWLALSLTLLILITPIITTRIRAEAGIFVHAYHWQAPRYFLIDLLGTRRLGPRNLTALSVFFFNRDYRPQQMPHQMEAFKIAETAQIQRWSMITVILVATVIGALIAFWVQLHLYYQHGASSGYFERWSTGYGREFFGRLSGWITNPTETDWLTLLFVTTGFSTMIGLVYLRLKFFWLPLHPLGYVMAGNQEMSDLWLPLLICLVLKWGILQHGGVRSYRATIPFFLGLILGDYIMGSFWSLTGVIFGIQTYQFYP